MRTYGSIEFKDNAWLMTEAEPHVCIRLKAVFPKIAKTATPPFKFEDSLENAHELMWFMDRYPLKINAYDQSRMQTKKSSYLYNVSEMERILVPDYKPKPSFLKDGHEARMYQLQGKDLFMRQKRMLIGDDMGLGKTLIGIICALEEKCRPAIVVCQTHLPRQWKDEIEKYTDLKVYLIRGNKPEKEKLPPADVYITCYSRLSGWVDVFTTGIFKTVILDECQEVRVDGSQKYHAAKILSNAAEYCMGLSGTPIYNYGNEIWNVMNVIKPTALGSMEDFCREWCERYGRTVKDPKALGTYLREQYLMLRRTRADVGRELPQVNKIVHTVEYDDKASNSNYEIARQLAMKVISGSFVARGQAARELDIMVRRDTGIGKAIGVANYVRILLESGEPVILAGWHRAVYDIWLEQLREYKPVMYTGSESPVAKEAAKKAFINGETNLFIISLRSGVGLDGLQSRCKMVVIGELDWSPKVHEQLIARADRDGQKEQVTAIYLVCDEGSDPLVINMLGLKGSQSQGIMDPLEAMQETYSDDSRMKLLAEEYLKKHKS